MRPYKRGRGLEVMLVGTQGFGFLASVTVARAVGPSGRGTLVALGVWAQVLGWTACFSSDKAIAVLGRSRGEGAALADRLYRGASRLTWYTIPVVSIVGYLLGGRLFSHWYLSVALCAGLAASARFELRLGWLLARANMRAYAGFRMIQPSAYLLITVAIVGLSRSQSYETRTAALALGLVLSLLAPVVCAHLAWGRRQGEGRWPMRSLVSFAAPAQLGAGLQFLNGRLDLLLLPFVASTREVGLYAVAASAGQLIVFLGSAALVRGIVGEPGTADVIGLATVALSALALVLIAPIIVPLVFGEPFRPAIGAARILIVGGVFGFGLQDISGRLLGQGRAWQLSLVQGLGAGSFLLGLTFASTIRDVALANAGSYVVAVVAGLLVLSHSRGSGAPSLPATGSP